MCLRPMVRMSPLESASAAVVAAIRVIDTSNGRIGSINRANANCTGPRTCPQFAPLVDMTAPKVRTSKKLAHIHWASSRAFCSSFGSFARAFASAPGMIASHARFCCSSSMARSDT